MDNNTPQRLKDAIEKSQSIGIAVGKDPSLDEMAAALGLYLVLKNLQKQVSIASSTEPIVALSSLVGIDRVQSKLGGEGGDLTVAFPYREGEIEKVSYTIENNRLNIIVKAGAEGLSFTENDVEYIRGGGGEINLLFVIGASQLADLGSVYSDDAFQGTTIVNIDNTTTNQRFGDIVLISDQFTSLSEQMSDLIMTLGLRIDVDTAQNLLDGIISATHNFQDPAASSLAFEMAGILMRAGGSREQAVAAANGPRQTNTPMPQVSQARKQASAPMREPIVQQPEAPMQQPMRSEMPQAQPKQQQPIKQQPQPMVEPDQNQDEPPSDWLTPKVYKGSSNF